MDKDFSQYFSERWAQNKRLYPSVVCEGVPSLAPPVLIVDAQSADPKLKTETGNPAVTPTVLPLNHVQLAKPHDKDSELFMLLRELLSRLPELKDPYAGYFSGPISVPTGERRVWRLAQRLHWSMERGDKTWVLQAWRNCRTLNFTPAQSDADFISQWVKFMVGEGTPENCLQGISHICAFLNENKGRTNVSRDLAMHTDEVVAWLVTACGAPLPEDLTDDLANDALRYPGYSSEGSAISNVLAAASHAMHKNWPTPGIGDQQNPYTAKTSDISALHPNGSVRSLLELWTLDNSISEPKNLSDWVNTTSIDLNTQQLNARQVGHLTHQIQTRQLNKQGLVLDAREGDLKEKDTSDLRQSSLLPILTVVHKANQAEGSIQFQLEKALTNYRELRTAFLKNH